MKRILFAVSELYPVIKTGGLADAAAGLTRSLRALGLDVLPVIPAYTAVLDALTEIEEVARLQVAGCLRPRQARVLRAVCADLDSPVLLVEIEDLFARAGNPYQGPDGHDWWDNGERFGLFAKVVTEIAMDRIGMGWKAQLVHCHDWQTGLIPALLSRETRPPRTLFTIHNLSYLGLFPRSLFDQLGLPADWWHYEKLEFYGYLSFLKAGILFADQVTTVSPSYAEEICRPENGYGLHGLLEQRRSQGQLQGILNGMDTSVWNPESDSLIPCRYSVKRGRVAGKKHNKEALLERFAASAELVDTPLCGFIGRLVEQKGIDLILDAIPQMIASSKAAFVLVGTGMAHYEAALRKLAADFPQRVFVHIGYDESLAHLIEAGCDLFLMPSRFEPCGLNQLYSLAYGTLPVVHGTGGLKDTVVDATPAQVSAKEATGFVFTPADTPSLVHALHRGLALYQRPRSWQTVQKTAMEQDFSWGGSAKAYRELYRR